MADGKDFHGAAATLLREAFEGREEGKNYTWFVEGREGILDALRSMTAERASRKVSDEAASLAGHAYHLLYTLRGANAWQGRPEPGGSWADSWRKQSVTEQEWRELADAIEAEYGIYRAWFAANEDWSQPDMFVGTLALLPHVAYHLGAMRQIIREQAG